MTKSCAYVHMLVLPDVCSELQLVRWYWIHLLILFSHLQTLHVMLRASSLQGKPLQQNACTKTNVMISAVQTSIFLWLRSAKNESEDSTILSGGVSESECMNSPACGQCFCIRSKIGLAWLNSKIIGSNLLDLTALEDAWEHLEISFLQLEI